MDLYLAHFLILAWAGLGTARRLVSSLADQLLVAGLLAWANLVATGLLLSALHRLGQPRWYFEVSAGLAVVICLAVLRWVRPENFGRTAGGDASAERPNAWLVGAFVITLAPLAAAILAVAYIYQPNNSDSLSHQLPRVLYYLGQGHLGHFDATDFRQLRLPFNYNLVQLGDFIYGAPLQCLNFCNVLAWALGGVAVYRLCRLAAFTANASLISCWLILTATPVLAQAASTTLELPLAAVMTAALVLILRWKHKHLTRDGVLAGIAVGVAAGADRRALIIAGAAGVCLLAQHYRQPQTRRASGLSGWAVPVALACGLGLPFLLLNLTAAEGHALFFPAVAGVSSASAGVWTLFQPVWQRPDLLAGLHEDIAGYGLTGAACGLAALWSLLRLRHSSGPAGWLAGFGFAWILLGMLLQGGAFPTVRDAVPVLFLSAPAVAQLVQEVGHAAAPRRVVLLLGVSVVAAAALWCGGVYLLYNTSRPFSPLLNATYVPPALPPLPLLLDYHLSRAAWINVDTDGTNERIFPLLATRRNQRITSRRALEPAAYNLLSRSSLSRNAGAGELERGAAYAVLPFPGKTTAGAEFLATVGRGAIARDYFGVEARSNETPATSGNQFLLVTLAAAEGSRADAAEMVLKIDGLNPADHARIVIDAVNEKGAATPLAAYHPDEVQKLSVPRPFNRLLLRLMDLTTDEEVSRTTLSYRAEINRNVQPLDPGLPSGPRSLFVSDLVLSATGKVTASEGLTPTEGPFPQWDLPYIRWARQPAIKLVLPATPELAQVKLTYSFRLHSRAKGALEVRFNGEVVDYLRIRGAATWVDRELDLPARPGENVVEFRDAPLKREPNWLEYLERYPDVKRFLIAQNLPLEEGARQHYENSGRKEGRTVLLDDTPPPAADTYYFMFRTLRVEGFKSP